MARDKDLELVDGDEELDEEFEDEESDDADDHDVGTAVGFLSGMLVGAVIGAGVALLLAPERGTVTRRRLQSRFEDVQEGARDRFDAARKETGRRLRKSRRRLKRRSRRRR